MYIICKVETKKGRKMKKQEKKYDRSAIMKSAWKSYKKHQANAIRNHKESHKSFGQCIKDAWAAYKRDEIETEENTDLDFADLM